VLNTTWVETGERIAYAPFSLKGVGDGTLRSMHDLIEPGSAERPQESLIRAAVASARFPAVLPAKVEYDHKKGFWWNFVDGGYADGSGTTTALDIFEAISKLDGAGNPDDGVDIDIDLDGNVDVKVDLRLLILTDNDAEAGLAPSGAGLVSAISPITTLLTMRELTGRRAVARAVSEIGGTGAGNGAQACGSKVARIVLDSRKLRLPLGWLISRHTERVIDHYVRTENSGTLKAVKLDVMGACRIAQ
jgi:hypothetical protein